MRLAVISDIHANLQGLNKALSIIDKEHVDKIVVCGDVVGYGHEPNECCDLIRKLGIPVVAGNHDWAVASLTDYSDFNSRATKGVEYTKKILTAENMSFLKALPLVYQDRNLLFVHSSPIEPEKWNYLTLDVLSLFYSYFTDAKSNINEMEERLCFVGHSHVPVIFMQINTDEIIEINPSGDCYFLEGRKGIINVGSVGEPRNLNKVASLVIYDTDTDIVYYKNFLLA